MKTFRMFTEDYVDSYALHRTSTGPGINGYVPTADLNASTKEYGKSLEKIAKDRAVKALSKKDRELLYGGDLSLSKGSLLFNSFILTYKWIFKTNYKARLCL